MAQYFQVHPDNPQRRLLRKVVDILKCGGVIAYPTDSSYAVGCLLGDKQAMARIRQLRRVGDDHNFTLVARDLSQIGVYAKVDNEQYRMIRALTPGPYTFILPATRLVPRRLQNPRRRTIGLRVPDSNVVRVLLEELGEPIMSSTLILPGAELPMSDPLEIREQLEHTLDLVIDGGHCGIEPTTVIEWVGQTPQLARIGKGDVNLFVNDGH